MMKCALLINEELCNKIFSEETIDELSETVEVIGQPQPTITVDYVKDLLGEADIAVTSWGSIRFERDLLDYACNLKMVAHAAGSVKPVISEEFIRRNIPITTAAPAIGIGVADYCMGAILMGGKRLKEQMRMVDAGGWGCEESANALELFGAVVGIVGAGFVGRRLIKYLQAFEVTTIWVFDPYLSKEGASALGVEKKSLEDIFSHCDYISINAPSTKETEGMITADLLHKTKDNAVFINTARGAIVDEQALIRELKTGRFCAFIDVTEPEPPVSDHPLRNLPNVVMTPHIAGAVSKNLRRIGALALREINSFVNGKPLQYPVDLSKIDCIA
ncbi:MAG: hydroxyacid dehydrogenase [bacterium]|jgi:phosphoglycerate dehydrogenase-like enzyme|nr:hydroxyacid dehydrogenase [bacterium]MDD3806113.1 hydroxyacid dehydrogenase [bacterium]MDD4559086.1 hydroxyacid dehydrogenase [bacterium]